MTSAAGIDEMMAWALTAVPHADDASVLRWFDALRSAHQACLDNGDAGWEALREQIGTVAGPEFGDVAAVEGFVAALDGTGQGAELIEQLLELHGHMPDLYWQVVGGGEAGHEAHAAAAGESGESGAGGFAWLNSEQHQTVHDWWGDGWDATLSEHLDARWGAGWQQHPDEHKTAWLDDLIREWSGAAEPTETTEPEPVEPEHAEHVEPEHAEPAAAHEQAHAEPATPEPAAEQVPHIPAEQLPTMVDEALKEVLAEIEGADELSEEDIEELRRELMQELGGTSAS